MCIKKRFIVMFAVAALVTNAAAQCDTWTSSTIRNCNGYDYELWNQNDAGSVNMKITGDNGSGANAKGGTFTATWSNTQNVLFRAGKKWGAQSTTTVSSIGNAVVDFAATWSSTDNVKMLGVYGWAYYPSGQSPTKQENGTNNNFSDQIEYYIIQDRGSYNPASGGTNAKRYPNANTTVTIDGIEYEFWVADRINQPMLTGNGNFKQYFSVPKNTSSHRQSGTITVSKHFEEWHKAGMIMSTCRLYEIAMKVESYTGSGSSNGNATVTKNLLTLGGTSTNKHTLTTNVAPVAEAGTITRDKDSSSYSPGTSVKLTAVAQQGWEFTGWSGGGTSGSVSTVTVTMNESKTVTATFKPLPGNTTNLIKNGNFANTQNWTLNKWQNSNATFAVSGGNANITGITMPTGDGAADHSLQLVQNSISLTAGMKYRLTFEASAASARTMSVYIQMDGDPYTPYLTKDVSLTSTKVTFEYEFDMTTADDNARIAFNFGGASPNVTISNVHLGYSSGGSTNICPQNPSSLTGKKASSMRVTTKRGSAVNVNFRASGSGETTVRLFSLKGDVLSTTRMQTVAGGTYAHTFNTSRVPAGFYIVEMRNGTKIEQARIALSK